MVGLSRGPTGAIIDSKSPAELLLLSRWKGSRSSLTKGYPVRDGWTILPYRWHPFGLESRAVPTNDRPNQTSIEVRLEIDAANGMMYAVVSDCEEKVFQRISPNIG